MTGERIVEFVKWTAIAAVAAAAPAARAEPAFEDAAARAEPVEGAEGLAALVWFRVADCAREADDLARRQCEAVRAARARQRGQRTFLFDMPGAGVVTVGDWDPKKKSAPVTLSPCLACGDGVDVDGRRFQVVGGKAGVDGGRAVAAPLATTARVFADEAAYRAWRDGPAGRLRVQWIVRVDGAEVWTRGGVDGVSVRVVGYRAYDPCTGEVVVSDPASRGPAPVDRAACGGDAGDRGGEPAPPDDGGGDAAPAAGAKPAPPLPRRLSPMQINAAMAPVRKRAIECFDAYGVAGRASFHITVRGADGKVVEVEQSGDFVGTPTGTCLEDAVRAVTFRPFRKATITFDFPVILQ